MGDEEAEKKPPPQPSVFALQFAPLKEGRTWGGILLGQVLALILVATGLTSKKLIDDYQVLAPNAQNFIFYSSLCVYLIPLFCRSDLCPVFQMRAWKYFLVALADVEGNFLIVKAYQLTTLTSVQLLDCFSLPVCLVLSWLVLKIRYKIVHILGVFLSIMGICCLVLADLDLGAKGSQESPGKSQYDRFKGDMICLVGAALYGVSNVSQEFVVKTFDSIEFLAMIGFFGTVISGAQTFLLEFQTVKESLWRVEVYFYLGAFALCQFVFYSLSTVFIRMTSATACTLSLLSADLYSLFAGVYLFNYVLHPLYFLSLLLVLAGVIVFSLKPTQISSTVYRSITRSRTTTVDLELIGAGPQANTPLMASSESSIGQTPSRPV